MPQVIPLSPSELHVSWQPPRQTNGDVTHYRIWIRKMKLLKEEYKKRDYCDYSELFVKNW